MLLHGAVMGCRLKHQDRAAHTFLLNFGQAIGLRAAELVGLMLYAFQVDAGGGLWLQVTGKGASREAARGDTAYPGRSQTSLPSARSCSHPSELVGIFDGVAPIVGL